MTHLLDTNTCVDHLRQPKSSLVTGRLAAAPAGSVVLCSVVLAELLYGARRSAHPQQTITQVQSFCVPFVSLPFDDAAADQYGEIRAHLSNLGTPIGPNDLLIA